MNKDRIRRQDSDDSKYARQRALAIRAAASVFAEKGFHGTSTRDIAAHMGIQQGSLYYYFRSKAEALEEVCLLALTDYVGRMEAIMGTTQSFEAKLQALITAHLVAYREKDEALKVFNDERLYLPESRRTRFRKLGSHYRDRLEHLFEEARREQLVRDDLDCHFAAHSVIGLCNAWGDMIVRDPDLDTVLLAQNCTQLLLAGAKNQTN